MNERLSRDSEYIRASKGKNTFFSEARVRRVCRVSHIEKENNSPPSGRRVVRVSHYFSPLFSFPMDGEKKALKMKCQCLSVLVEVLGSRSGAVTSAAAATADVVREPKRRCIAMHRNDTTGSNSH